MAGIDIKKLWEEHKASKKTNNKEVNEYKINKKKDFAEFKKDKEESGVGISKEDYERAMSQGKREDMNRLLEYKLIKFGETKKRKGVIKIGKEYIEVENSKILEEKEIKEEEKTKILLDRGYKRNISNVCIDIAKLLKDKQTLFYRTESQQIVEIQKIKIKKSENESYDGFKVMTEKRFITLVEKYAELGEIENGKFGKYFATRSLSPTKSGIILNSEILENSLPQISRIFTVPIPIIYEGELTFPKKGYDPRFESWLPFNSPKIENLKMSIEEAKKIINTIFEEFCFKSEQDKINAISALLTPFLRGLFKNFNTRTPLIFYLGNRERVGKDYCAGITGIVYEGVSLDDNPISNGTKSNNNDELRKKITSAMINGRKRFHSANNKGYINNAVLEQVLTSEYYSDRILGGNKLINIPNEMDFSLSGNVGVTYTPDFANRCRFVNLFLDIEDANSRKFKNPNLHEWVLNNRPLILSALYSLVRNWFENNTPNGQIPFASFPEWANICGGIMETAGYGSPCVQDKENISLAGDSETTDMKRLFELCYFNFPNQKIKRKKIIELVEEENELFGYLDFTKRKDQIGFSLKLRKYLGRILSGIKLNVADLNVRVARQEYIFKKELVKNSKNNNKISKNNLKSGNDGNLGNDRPLVMFKGVKRLQGVDEYHPYQHYQISKDNNKKPTKSPFLSKKTEKTDEISEINFEDSDILEDLKDE